MTGIKLWSLPLLLALGGCAASLELQDAAVDPAWHGREPERIMVIGLDERRFRNPFERIFVDELRVLGFNAVVSATFATAIRDFDDQREFPRIIGASRADSLLTVRAVGFDRPSNEAWAAGYVRAALFADNASGIRPMRGRGTAGAAPDNVTAAYYGFEAQFFDVAGDRLVWTARTPIFEAGDMDELVVAFAEVAVDDLLARGVIRP